MIENETSILSLIAFMWLNSKTTKKAGCIIYVPCPFIMLLMSYNIMLELVKKVPYPFLHLSLFFCFFHGSENCDVKLYLCIFLFDYLYKRRD